MIPNAVLDQVNSGGYHVPGVVLDVHFGHSCSVLGEIYARLWHLDLKSQRGPQPVLFSNVDVASLTGPEIC